MSETDLVRAILKYLHVVGILAWRQNTGAASFQDAGRSRFVRFGVPGISDILGVLPDGRFLAIEVKMPGRKVTWKQCDFINAITDNGGLAFVATSIEDVQEKLKLA